MASDPTDPAMAAAAAARLASPLGAALDGAAPEIARTYRELGRQTVPIALAKGRINGTQAENILTTLSA